MYEPPFPYFPRVQTQAFLLRQPAIMDARFWESDHAVYLTHTTEVNNFRQLIHQLMRAYHQGQGVYWMAVDNETQSVHGVLALEGDFKQGRCMLNVLAYQEPFLAASWEEAFREVLQLCFKTLKVMNVSTAANAYTGGWQDVLQGLGFVKEGPLFTCSRDSGAKS